MMFDEIRLFLDKSFADHRLDSEERDELRELVAQLSEEQCRFAQNAAFDRVRSAIKGGGDEALRSLQWLERVNKTLTSNALHAAQATVHFSPGDACRRKLKDLLHAATAQVDICVFTISDDRLSDAIIETHERGVAVRVITDNDKSLDDGSDIARMLDAGVALRKDRSRYHMHHKFAVFDNATLASGSFNWTRSASKYNQENILVSNAPAAVQPYSRHFDELWAQYLD
jgi:phosphatidylserine/phosphatidylglycerophosphate/cardiolipin synthase-like enzyme